MRTLHKEMIGILVDRAFKEFKKIYGNAWTEKTGRTKFEKEIHREAWIVGLIHLETRKIELAFSNFLNLDKYLTDYPPSLMRFRTFCKNQKSPEKK